MYAPCVWHSIDAFGVCTYIHTVYNHTLCSLSFHNGSNCNLVEAHCYGIGRTGQLLSNHVAVETVSTAT